MTADNTADELGVFLQQLHRHSIREKISELGNPLVRLSERVPFRATIDKDVIIGSIIFIDSYGNAISNITREVFYRVFQE